MTPAEARVIAHICGDGYIGTYVEKHSLQIVNGRRYYRPRTRYQLVYTNTEELLRNNFLNDVLTSFNIKGRRRGKFDVVFCSKRVFEIIKTAGGGKTYEWTVGNQIFEANNKIKAAWLQAFFDDEATVEKTGKRIRIKSMNWKGLEQIQQLLLELKLASNITGPNVDRSWYLTIRKKELFNFRKKIGFTHPNRKKKLDEIIKEN